MGCAIVSSMEDSIFTKIINHEIPAEFIYEDEHCIVIPDRFPSMLGQALVIPKQQETYIFALDDDTYHHLMDVTKKIGCAMDKAFNTIRTCIVIEGFEVPHVHIKLYPCTQEKMAWEPKKEVTDEKLKEISEQIKAHL